MHSNVVFNVYAKPVVDKNGKELYKLLKITKKKEQKEEELVKGKLLTFLSTQSQRLENLLEEGKRFLLPLPIDFLILKSQISALNLKKYNFLLKNPAGKFTNKHLFEIKKLLKEYIQNDLEISFEAEIYEEYKYQFPPKQVSFICKSPDWKVNYHKNCIKNVDTEEIFNRVKGKGDLFYGKIFGDFKLVTEITALSFLKNAIVRALELLENEEVKIDELEKVIKTDPKLTVNLIKYANSPLIAPPSPIKDLKHALVYLGLNKVKQYLTVLMFHELASVDKEFEELAIRLSAVGMLMEEKGKALNLAYNPCQLLMAGIALEASKVFGKDIGFIIQMLEVPSTCIVPVEDKKILKLYKDIEEKDVVKRILELKKILGESV